MFLEFPKILSSILCVQSRSCLKSNLEHGMLVALNYLCTLYPEESPAGQCNAIQHSLAAQATEMLVQVKGLQDVGFMTYIMYKIPDGSTLCLKHWTKDPLKNKGTLRISTWHCCGLKAPEPNSASRRPHLPSRLADGAWLCPGNHTEQGVRFSSA